MHPGLGAAQLRLSFPLLLCLAFCCDASLPSPETPLAGEHKFLEQRGIASSVDNQTVGVNSQVVVPTIRLLSSENSSCADFASWPDVDQGVTCGGCTALVLTTPHGGRCDRYCESFGHTCLAAGEEFRETCNVSYTSPCDAEIAETSDMLCTCALLGEGSAPSEPAPITPLPSPEKAACADFVSWPSVDGGVTCEGCTALVLVAPYGGRCDAYCQSFGHACLAAAEEVDETCQVLRTSSCDAEIAGTSDMLCTCALFGEASDPSALGPSTPLQPDDCIELLAIGDYGTRDGAQRSVAAGLAAVAAQKEPVVIAGLGDNVYENGAEGQFSLIVDSWVNIYLQYSSLKRPWYIVTGNHDWYTDASTERDFTDHDLNEGGWWRMPGFWYKRSFEASGFVVDAFFIDTQVWIGSWRTELVLGKDAREEQIAWLTSELSRSTAHWKLVFGHHPVYSAGAHGSEKVVLEELDPLMRKFGVQVFFSGHDHSQQLMQHRGLNYVVSGAGGKYARGRADEYPAGSQQVLLESLGFAGLSVCGKSNATLNFYSATGQVQATRSLSSTLPDPEPAIPDFGRRRRAFWR